MLNAKEGRIPSAVYINPKTAVGLKELQRRNGDKSIGRTVERLVQEASHRGSEVLRSSNTVAFLPDVPYYSLIDSTEEIEDAPLFFPLGKWLERGLTNTEKEDPAVLLLLIGKENSLPNLNREEIRVFLNGGGQLSIFVDSASIELKDSLAKLKDVSEGNLHLYESNIIDSTSYSFVSRSSGTVDVKIALGILESQGMFVPSFFLSAKRLTNTTQAFNDAVRKIARSAHELPL